MSKKDKLLKIFISTLYLSAFTFGGGYVIVSLMKKKFVDEYKWIDEQEMLDLVAIAQSATGAIAVNGAIVVGYKLAGILGVLVSILGTIIPPFVIISIISVTLEMGSSALKDKKISSAVIMVIAFIATFFLKINVIYIVIACILFGISKALIWRKMI